MTEYSGFRKLFCLLAIFDPPNKKEEKDWSQPG
jgi:hypothetical protein